tara:strand:+ start:374 stop:625 length:252 start_codon:yes stop_codon:yes gene_type:complete
MNIVCVETPSFERYFYDPNRRVGVLVGDTPRIIQQDPGYDPYVNFYAIGMKVDKRRFEDLKHSVRLNHHEEMEQILEKHFSLD